MKKIVILAGGTGGHIFPALTIADQCYAQGVSVHWLGSQGGMEESLVPTHYHLVTLPVAGLRGKGWRRYCRAPWQLFKAIRQARAFLRRVQPDVVLGMGGFASGPGGVAAWLARIPLVIHEQNAVAGLTNRCLAYLASDVLQAFDGSFVSAVRARVVGNPVRKNIVEIPSPSERFDWRRGPARVLILGGSQGASAINQVVVAMFEQWQGMPLPLIWHQAGADEHAQLQLRYQAVSPTVIVEVFIEKMEQAYEWADVIIVRSGALTVSEMAVSGQAGILIPYPHAVDDHQFHNAVRLQEVGAAMVVRQDELSAEKLTTLLQGLCFDRKKILAMAERGRRVASPTAGSQVLAACQNAIRKKSRKRYVELK